MNEKHLSNVEPPAALRRHLDTHAVLWTASMAWVTSIVTCKIANRFHNHLAPYQDTYHKILSSGGCRAHLTRAVCRALKRTRIMYHLLPAKMTWELRPIDTDVFRVLQDILRRECQRLALPQQDERLTWSLLLQRLARTIPSDLSGASWRSAFWDISLNGVQATVSDRVLEKLQLRGRPGKFNA